MEEDVVEFDGAESDFAVGRQESNPNHTKLGSYPGVYVLLAKGNPIPKIKCHDQMGILYIGKASNLSRRLDFGTRSDGFQTRYNLKGVGRLSADSFDHSCLTFCLDFDATKKKLTFDSHLLNPGSILVGTKPLIFIRYDANPDQMEKDLLHEHFDKFGCLPFFNNNGISLKSFFRCGRSTAKLLDELGNAFNAWKP